MSASLPPQSSQPKIIEIPINGNVLLEKVLTLINTNEEIKTLWKITNVTAIKRLSMTDHGILHFQIVAQNALQIARIFEKKEVKFSICKDYGLSSDHAEVVILLASLLHDLGMSVHRSGHEEYSLFLVNTLLREILSFLPVPERTILTSEVLHAIISHRKDGQPLTVEAGIVRVADALDMSEGRTRFPYEEGKLDIHSVSAMAIDAIEIKPGRKTPVQVDISMNHTAGIFQVDELLKKKVMGSGIEKHLEIKIYIDKGKGKQLFKDFFQG
ncbi:MAG: HD domain-containing protein [Candidatus Woesebacteria bacterium]